MNYFVHANMYFYFFCQCFGPLRRATKPFAIGITLLQLLQMVAGTAVTCYSAYQYMTYGPEACAGDQTSYTFGLLMYLSYFVLFAKLFVSNYIGPNAKHSANAAKKSQ